MKLSVVAPSRRSQTQLVPLQLLVLAIIILLCPSFARGQIAFAGIQSTIGSGFSYPAGVAVDGHGNVYVADDSNNAVDEIVAVDGSIPSSPTIITVGSGFSGPYGLAVDSSGDLYVANSGNNTVNEIVAVNGIFPSSPTILTLGSGFSQPEGVAVDSSGNVYVADTMNNAVKEIVAVNGSIPSSPTILTLGSGFNLPTGVALDASGDVYVADGYDSTLFVIEAVNGSIPSNPVINTVGSGFNYLISIAVDASGNVYVADNNNDAVKEILAVNGGIPSSPTIITLGSGYNHPQGIAVDAHGNVFVGDSTNQRVEEFETESVNIGGQAIGSASAVQSLNFSIPAGTTVGSVGILTSGTPGLDFVDGGSSTCTATTYSSATNCVVNVTFKPAVAGPRSGAVVFYSGANNTGTVLASIPVYGVGTGPQMAYGPGTAVTISPVVNGTSLVYPVGMAVDGAGDLFIADQGNGRLVEVPAGGGAATATAATVNGVALSRPLGVAVDGAGDLFIADFNNNRIVEIPAGGGAATAIDPTVNGEALYDPTGVAVDGAGDIFISDYGNNRIVEVPAGDGMPMAIDPTVNGEALSHPFGVAVDGAGDLFISDGSGSGSRMVEVPAGGGAATAINPTVDGEALNEPIGVAVDGAGDLFIADYGNSRVVEIPADGGAPTLNGGGLSLAAGVAVDGAGDLFIADTNNGRIVELQRSQPPALNFPTPTTVGTTDTADGTMTVQVQNIGNQALNFTAVNYPADFSAASDPNPCIGSTSLSEGAECDLPIQFTPQSFGSLNEAVALTDNNLNLSAANQSIALAGTGAGVYVTIGTSPTGFSFSIDGSPYSTTQTLVLGIGTPYTLATTSPQNLGVPGVQYVFSQWSDGTTSLTDTLTPTASTSSDVANFNTQYLLTVTAGSGGTITATTATNGFYNTGTVQTLIAAPNDGYYFTGWTGSSDIASPSNVSTTITMNSPETVTANFALIAGAITSPAGINFGSQEIGTASAVQTLNFSISAGTYVGSIGILTSGSPGLDFADGGSSTCTATTYSTAANCVVNVTFNPAIAGPESGAIVFFSGANNTGTVLANVPLWGIGEGPQLIYGPGVATAIDPTLDGVSLNQPYGVAVDGAGNMFIADYYNNRIVKVPAGGGAATAIDPTVDGESLFVPAGVTVDGAGDLFISDYGNNRIVEVPAGGGAATAIDPTVDGESLSNPAAVAFDAAGDLFIVDFNNSRIVEVPAGGGAATVVDTTVNGETLGYPNGMAVDAAGDLFITNTDGNTIVEVPAGGGAPTSFDPTVNGEALFNPVSLAVDGAGDLFISDYGNNRIVEMPAGGGAPTAFDPTANGAGLLNPFTLAIDRAGDLFIADLNNNRIVELNRSQPPVLTFPTPTTAGATDTTDGIMTVQVQNIGNQPLNFTAVGYPADFSAASDPNPCIGSTSLNNGQLCDLPVQFTPQIGGTLSEDVNFTDNNLNVAGVQQSILVIGQSVTVAQTITFAPLSAMTLGAAPFAVSATSSSGLPVSFASTTPTVCTVSGSTVTLVAHGACSIEATQAGNTVYAAAPAVTRGFVVSKESQTISFAALPQQTYGAAPITVSATASSGLAVSFASTTSTVCTVSGSTVTLVEHGACSIEATQAGNSNYAAAPAITQSFTINKESQTISFAVLSSQTYGAAPFSVSATASSGLPVSFASTTSAVCTVSGNTVTLVATGTCSVNATQAGNANYAAAPAITQSFAINKESQTISFAALPPQTYGAAPFSVSATANSGLPVSFASTTSAVCTVSGSTVTLVATGTCSVKATQAGNTDYAAALAVTQSFTVNKGSQTITFTTIPATPLLTGSVSLIATSSSGLPVSFVLTTPSVCTVSGSTVTLVAAGTCSVRATQVGNTDYLPAAAVTQSFSVYQTAQTITFSPLSAMTYGAAPFSVSATASSGLPVSFASTTSSVCTVSGSTVTLVATGTCSVKATQAGNTDYAAALAVTQSFTVNKGSQTITFTTIPATPLLTGSVSLIATASSGLPVSFVSTTPSVCTVSGSTVTLVATGTCSIRATQVGNTDYAAAPAITQSFAVSKESQTISFAALPAQTLGGAPFTVSATASSGLPVSFASTTSTVCTVSGSTVTLVAHGACTIEATQAGNTNYAAAPAITQSFTVSKESQTISFAALPTQALGAAPFTVSATASSGLPVSFASTTSTVCTVSGSTVTLVAHGACSIQATQIGNTDYAAAPAVTRSFAVSAN